MGWNSIPVQGVAVKAPKGTFYVLLAWKYLWQLLDEGYISLSSLPSVLVPLSSYQARTRQLQTCVSVLPSICYRVN